MLVIENQKDFLKCSNIETLSNFRLKNSNSTNSNETQASKKNNYSINRYRSKTYDNQNSCYDYFANESEIFQCNNSVNFSSENYFIYLLLIKFKYFFSIIYSIILVKFY